MQLQAWRLLQSKAGVENQTYLAQRSLLAKIDKGEVSLEDFRAKSGELFEAELAAVTA